MSKIAGFAVLLFILTTSTRAYAKDCFQIDDDIAKNSDEIKSFIKNNKFDAFAKTMKGKSFKCGTGAFSSTPSDIEISLAKNTANEFMKIAVEQSRDKCETEIIGQLIESGAPAKTEYAEGLAKKGCGDAFKSVFSAMKTTDQASLSVKSTNGLPFIKCNGEGGKISCEATTVHSDPSISTAGKYPVVAAGPCQTNPVDDFACEADLKKKMSGISRVHDWMNSIAMAGAFWRLGSISGDLAVFSYQSEQGSYDYLVAVKKAKIKKALRPGVALQDVVDCVKFLKESKMSNAAGFPVSVKIYDVVQCQGDAI